jgi:hypothetical protein
MENKKKFVNKKVEIFEWRAKINFILNNKNYDF